MRFWLAAVAVVVAAGLGCEGDGGAVSVRWHIVDLSSGQLIDPSGSVAQPDGSCAMNAPDSTRLWTIDRIRLVIANPLTGVEEPPTCAASGCLSFKCSQTEATTPFSLSPGIFALSLRAIAPQGDAAAGGDDETVTPAPAVRAIKRAEVVNLDVVEIGVRPLPLAVFDGGSPPPDLAAPDAGPVM